jgi:hypothetical protein
MQKIKAKYREPLKKAFESTLINSIDFYQEIHIDTLAHPINSLRAGRKMLPAICGLLMELVEIVKACDTVENSWEIGGYIPLLPTAPSTDFPIWKNSLLDSIGKHSTPPSIGVFKDKLITSEVIEIYQLPLYILKTEYPKIHIVYEAMRGETEIKNNDEYDLYLRMMYMGPKN